MKAHLYKFPSDFRNIHDHIVIKATPMNSYPGNTLYTVLELPESIKVAESEYGEGFFFTEDGEIITEVFEEGQETISGNCISGKILIYDKHGVPILRRTVSWR